MADKEEDEDSNHDEEMSEEATVVQDETGEIEMHEGGQELGQMAEKELSIYTKLARFTQLLLASLLYCYVLVMIALRYVIPASLGPLLQHWADQVPAQPYRNASNAEGCPVLHLYAFFSFYFSLPLFLQHINWLCLWSGTVFSCHCLLPSTLSWHTVKSVTG